MSALTKSRGFNVIYDFEYDEDEERARFGTNQFFVAPAYWLEACGYDSDRDDMIVEDNSDDWNQWEPFEFETCYDSDSDSSSRQLQKDYLEKLKVRATEAE